MPIDASAESAPEGDYRLPTWFRAVDATLALLLLFAFGYSEFQSTFERLEWHDWVAYALPSANLVERGALSTPQLGTQAGYDRYWLFHAPVMVLGAVPFLKLLHVGRVPYLIGIVVGAWLNRVAFGWVIRKALRIESLALGLALSEAFLGHRHYLSSLQNQRYDIYIFAPMLLAFAPILTRDGRIPVWRWLCAGLLPLLHPAIFPAIGFWIAGNGVDWLVNRRSSPRLRTWVAWVGPACYGLGVLAALAWYGRLEALRTQFLPYLKCMAGRKDVGTTYHGLLYVPAGFPLNVPGRMTAFVVLGAAAFLAVAYVAKLGRERKVRPVVGVLPALTVLFAVAFDMVKPSLYLHYYFLSLGPDLLFSFAEGKRRKIAIAVLTILALANAAVTLRLDRHLLASKPNLADQADAIDFLVRSTQPGDRLVLGPPFLLASAPAELPGGRRVVAVVPQPFCLDTFDEAAFRRQLRNEANVYVGAAPWLFFADSFDWWTYSLAIPEGSEPINALTSSTRPPLVADPSVESGHFFGEPVVVARSHRSP